MRAPDVRTATALLAATATLAAGCSNDDRPATTGDVDLTDDAGRDIDNTDHAGDQQSDDRTVEQDDADEPDHDAEPDPEQLDDLDEPDEPDEPADPYAIPDDPADIDADYIDRVTDGLFEVRASILLAILGREPGEQSLTEDEVERLRAVTAGSALVNAAESYTRLADTDITRPAFLDADELGMTRWTTERVLDAGADCIVAIGHYDISEVAVQPYEDDEYAILSLSPDTELPEINPTPWRVRGLLALMAENGEPFAKDEWDDIDYADALDNTCS